VHQLVDKWKFDRNCQVIEDYRNLLWNWTRHKAMTSWRQRLITVYTRQPITLCTATADRYHRATCRCRSYVPSGILTVVHTHAHTHTHTQTHTPHTHTHTPHKHIGIALLFLDHGTRRWWVVSSTPRPVFTPGKDSVLILQEAGLVPGPVSTGAEILVPTGIRSLLGPSSL